MQYLDNDMDELFNKAGNDYPLRTDVPDFDRMLGKLNPDLNAAPKQNYRKYLLLLLLLPIGYLMNHSLSKRSVVNPSATKPLSEITTVPFPKIGEQTREPKDVIIDPEKHSDILAPGNVSPTASSTSLKRKEGKMSKDIFSVRSVENPSDQGQLLNIKQNFNNDKTQRDHGDYTIPRVSYSYKKPVIILPGFPIAVSSSNPIKSKQKSSIYIGILAGPDMSTVKYQSIKNIGFSIGILGGYKFSKHWSVETGLIYNSKKYYTDGKYFDKVKSGIPASVYLESLDGSCNMFEVPVSVRYDFSTSKNRFFSTLGATSYIMKKEKYTYDAYAAGNYYKGHRSYDNSGSHLFSNMQFSIGYNRQLSNKINLRIEPYIKVPVHDIGIGNLPITSSGIYLSIMQIIR